MFIVIEGIDGAGCETQAKLVRDSLIRNSQSVNPLIKLIKFPHYDTPVGKMIKEFLYENKSLKAHEQFLLYTLQFIFDAPLIRKKLQITNSKSQTITNIQYPSLAGRQAKSKKEVPILIADRYFTTTLCYQTLEGFNEKVALKYADDFGIIKPDLVFFLDVKPETAIEWKYGENKAKNFREKDHEFIKRTYEKYLDLVNRQVWTRWIRINGEQPKETVTHDIINKLLNYE